MYVFMYSSFVYQLQTQTLSHIHTPTSAYENTKVRIRRAGNELKRALLVHSAHVLPCPATHRPEMKPKVVGQTHGANACRHISVPYHLAVIRGGN